MTLEEQLPFVVQCQWQASAAWETMCAFNCRPAAINYAERCADSKFNQISDGKVITKFLRYRVLEVIIEYGKTVEEIWHDSELRNDDDV